MKTMRTLNYRILLLAVAGLCLSSCYDTQQKASAENTTDSPGTEYAPQMYHSEAYEPMSQVVDKESGMNHWPYEKVGGGVSDYDSLAEGHGEWYSSNYYNAYGMNMRQPVAGTVAHGKNEFKYNIAPTDDSTWFHLNSPVTGNAKAIEDGKLVYQAYCQHCHGENGDGKGAAGLKFGGVPNYHTKGYRAKTRGSIYQTITFGRNAMRSHAAQVDPLDRWKVAEYIKDWQAKVESEESK
jgi:mono/diheme cytochrome c family protein